MLTIMQRKYFRENKRAAFCIVLFFIQISQSVYAVDEVKDKPKAQTQPDSLGPFSRMERGITKGINTLSSDMDSFFSRDEALVEKSGSRVHLGYSASYAEHSKPGYDFIFSANLVLPRTQEKLHFVVFSDEKDTGEVREGSGVVEVGQAEDAVKNQKIGIGLRNLFYTSKTSAITSDAGVKARIPPEPFFRFMARRSFFWDQYEFKLIDRQRWYNSEGWSTLLTAELDKILSPVWLFRFSNNGNLEHDTGLWQVDDYLALYQKISPRTAMGYSIGITGDDETTLALQTYFAAVSFRHILIPDWLFFQMTPKLTWPRLHDWQEVPGIFFKLESVFGG